MKRPEVIDDLPLFEEILYNTSQESKLYVTRSLAIANQILVLLEKRGMKQKDLATSLGKKEAEVSRWLTGFHNFTIKSITKIEVALGEQIFYTAQESEQEVVNAVKPYSYKAYVRQSERLTKRKPVEFSYAGSMEVKTTINSPSHFSKEEDAVEPFYIGRAS